MSKPRIIFFSYCMVSDSQSRLKTTLVFLPVLPSSGVRQQAHPFRGYQVEVEVDAGLCFVLENPTCFQKAAESCWQRSTEAFKYSKMGLAASSSKLSATFPKKKALYVKSEEFFLFPTTVIDKNLLNTVSVQELNFLKEEYENASEYIS